MEVNKNDLRDSLKSVRTHSLEPLPKLSFRHLDGSPGTKSERGEKVNKNAEQARSSQGVVLRGCNRVVEAAVCVISSEVEESSSCEKDKVGVSRLSFHLLPTLLAA